MSFLNMKALVNNKKDENFKYLTISSISAFLLFLIFVNKSFSATYYLQGSVNPASTANWNSVAGGGGSAPTNFTTGGDIFIIDNDAATMTGNWTLGANVNLQISNGASLDVNNKDFTCGGTLTVDGTFSDGSNAGANVFTGLVTITGSFTVNSNSNCDFYGGLINNGGTCSFGGNQRVSFAATQDIDGTALISFGTSTDVNVVVGATVTNKNDVSVDMLRTGTGTLKGSGAWVQGANSRLNYYGSTITVTGGLDFDSNVNIVDYASTSSQTILSETYYTMYVSGGNTKTLGGAITVRNLDINTDATELASDIYQITGNASGTFTMSGNSILSLGKTNNAANTLFPSNFTNGNITLSAGTVVYQNNSAQTVSPVPAYYNLEVKNNGTTKTVGSGRTTLSVAGTLTVSGTSTLNLGSTVTTLSVTGATSIAGTLDLNTVLTTVNLSSTLAVAGTLTFNGTSTKTMNVTGNLSGAGTINMSGGSLLHILNLSGSTNAISTFTTAAVASEVNYVGTTQTIFSSANYRNVTIGGSGVKTLAGNTTVGGVFTMGAGSVDMGGFTLTIGTAAATPGSLSYTSGTLYNGTLTRWFNNSTTIADNVTTGAGMFPVGTSSNFRPFYVYWTTAPSTGGTLTVTHSDPGTNTPTTVSIADGVSTIVRRGDIGWTLTAANSFNIAINNLNVRFAGTTLGTIGSVGDLRVMLSGSVIGTAGTNGGSTSNPIVKRTALPAFTAAANTFYLGSVDASNSPLPIELLSFKGNLNNNKVALNWVTATETNNNYFVVEKSLDGINFETLMTVKSLAPNGNSTSSLYYSVLDEEPQDAILYYRLKQVDFNGDIQALEMISVIGKNGQTFDFNVYPNPNTGTDINIVFIGRSANSFLVSVRDVDGRQVFSKEFDCFRNIATPLINLDLNLISGVYLVAIQTQQFLETKKLVVN